MRKQKEASANRGNAPIGKSVEKSASDGGAGRPSQIARIAGIQRSGLGARHLYRGHSLRRDPFASAGEAQSFRRRGLHAHSVAANTGDASDAVDHGVAM